MDLSLSEQQEMIRRMARDFVDREVIPFAAEWDRAEQMDRGIVTQMASLGLLGITVPQRLGGSEGDHLSYCLVMEELGRGDSSVRGVVSVSLGLFAKTVLDWGTDEQRLELLPQICAGEAIGCFGLTEPGAGSDPASLSTRAVRAGDDWLITGSKMFITNGTWADFSLIFARTKREASQRDQSREITCFIVPTDAPGFSARPIKGKLGLRAQDTAELTLDEVRVPDRNRLGEESRGMRVALSALSKGRMSLAAGCVGIAQGCLEASLEYAAQRQQFGRAIAGFQLVQEMLADMAVETEASRLLTWKVAHLIDAGQAFAPQASSAKYFASEAAVRAASAAVQIFGGYGYIDEYPVSKYLRDARVTTLYEGTSQIQKLIIGHHLTGISAFA